MMNWKRGFTAAGIVLVISATTIASRSSTPVLTFAASVAVGLLFVLPLIAAAVIDRRDARRYRGGRPRAESHSEGPLW